MARPTVRILSRYILRQHIPPLLYALAALTFAMLVNQVAKQFGNFVGKGLPWGVIFEVFALSIPFIVAMTLPMAVLVAVLYTFSHLAADNEVTAMKASGISVGRILAPVLGGATLIGLIALLWNDQILPRSNHTLRTLLVDIQRKKPTFQLKEQVINEVVAGQFFLRATRIDPATNALNDVTIYDLEDPDRRRIIMADSGRMAYSSGGTDLYLTLRDGEMHEIKRTDPVHFSRTFYTVNRIKVAGVSNTFEPTKNDEYRGDREMTICAMQDVVARANQDLRRVRSEAVLAVASELRRIAKLAALAPPSLDTTAPPLSTYCRALGSIKRLFAPRAAQAAQATPASQGGGWGGGGTDRHESRIHGADAVGVQPAASGSAAACGRLRSRDSEETGDLGSLRNLRPARHAARHSLPAGRRRARDRHEPGSVFGLLRRPHRRRGAGRPAHRAAVLRDVDAESHFPDRRDTAAPVRAPRRQHRAWR